MRAIKSIDEPSLPLRVYGPMRLTYRASQGMHITILDGGCPYFSDRFLFIWQVLHDFIMDRMVTFLSSISQLSLSLRDGYAWGAEDNGHTISSRAIAMASVL